MSEENLAEAAANGAAAAAPQLRMQVLAQYIRDMSFENEGVRKGLAGSEVQPDVQVAVSLDARKRTVEHQYDVILKFKITSSNKTTSETLFLLELEYGGTFHVEGVAEEQLHPFLLIECPRYLFPYARQIISQATADGGFYPPFNVEPIDFGAIYMARQQQIAGSPSETGQA